MLDLGIYVVADGLAPPYSDWDRIKSPAADQIIPYDKLPKKTDPKSLNKLAVLKVNGGLGTSMGSSPSRRVSFD